MGTNWDTGFLDSMSNTTIRQELLAALDAQIPLWIAEAVYDIQLPGMSHTAAPSLELPGAVPMEQLPLPLL